MSDYSVQLPQSALITLFSPTGASNGNSALQSPPKGLDSDSSLLPSWLISTAEAQIRFHTEAIDRHRQQLDYWLGTLNLLKEAQAQSLQSPPSIGPPPIGERKFNFALPPKNPPSSSLPPPQPSKPVVSSVSSSHHHLAPPSRDRRRDSSLDIPLPIAHLVLQRASLFRPARSAARSIDAARKHAKERSGFLGRFVDKLTNKLKDSSASSSMMKIAEEPDESFPASVRSAWTTGSPPIHGKSGPAFSPDSSRPTVPPRPTKSSASPTSTPGTMSLNGADPTPLSLTVTSPQFQIHYPPSVSSSGPMVPPRPSKSRASSNADSLGAPNLSISTAKPVSNVLGFLSAPSGRNRTSSVGETDRPTSEAVSPKPGRGAHRRGSSAQQPVALKKNRKVSSAAAQDIPPFVPGRAAPPPIPKVAAPPSFTAIPGGRGGPPPVLENVSAAPAASAVPPPVPASASSNRVPPPIPAASTSQPPPVPRASANQNTPASNGTWNPSGSTLNAFSNSLKTNELFQKKKTRTPSSGGTQPAGPLSPSRPPPPPSVAAATLAANASQNAPNSSAPATTAEAPRPHQNSVHNRLINFASMIHQADPSRLRKVGGGTLKPADERDSNSHLQASPTNSISSVAPNRVEAASIPEPANPGPLRIVRALYSYRSEDSDPDFISFEVGDRFRFIRRFPMEGDNGESGGWWEVEKVGNQAIKGVVPSNFFDIE